MHILFLDERWKLSKILSILYTSRLTEYKQDQTIIGIQNAFHKSHIYSILCVCICVCVCSIKIAQLIAASIYRPLKHTPGNILIFTCVTSLNAQTNSTELGIIMVSFLLIRKMRAIC